MSGYGIDGPATEGDRDLELIIAAIAINAFTAWVVIADVEREHPSAPRARPEPSPRAVIAAPARGETRIWLPAPRDAGAPPAAVPAAAAPRAGERPPEDPWVVVDEPLFEQAAVTGGAVAGAVAPVLAYVDVPRRSPAAERLIQTEVLLPEGLGYRVLAFARLMLVLVVSGLALGFGILGGVRAIGWLIGRLAG